MAGKLFKKINYYYSGLQNLRSQAAVLKNKQILLIQNTGLGDMCHLIPFARQLKNEGYGVEAAAPDAFKPVWTAFVNPRRYFALNEQNVLDPDQSEKLKLMTYEAVFSVSMNPAAAWISTLPESKNRYGMIEGFKYYRGARLFYSKTIRVDKHQHVADRYWDLFRNWNARFKLEDLHGMTSSVQPGKVVLHPGAKWKPRRWMPKRYQELALRIAGTGKRVHILLHPGEDDLIHYFNAQTPDDGIQMVLTKTVQDLMDQIKDCAYFIGNDSGPVHLANLFNKPLSVIWGPGDLKRIRPLGENVQIIRKEIGCRPCQQYKNPERCTRGVNDCLQKITVDEVFDLISKHMAVSR